MPKSPRRRKPQSMPQATKPSTRDNEKDSLGYCGYLSWIFGAFAAYIAYLCYQAPIQPVVITDLGERVLLEGNFEPNDLLHKGKRLLEGYTGPECVAFDGDENLYTGLMDGRILKVGKGVNNEVGEGMVTEIKMNKFYETWEQERPLGMRFFNGYLYVADCYLGIYKLDVNTGKRELLVRHDDIKPPSRLIDDLDITKDGKFIYFSSASTRHSIMEPAMDHFEGICTGSVYRYNTVSKNIEMFANNLCFGNGVQLSPDEKTLLIGETPRFRVLMYDVETKTINKVIRFPMYPDNIRATRDGGYLIGMVVPWTGMLDIVFSSPFLRRFAAGVLGNEMIVKLMTSFKDPTGYVKLNANGDVEQFVCDSESVVAQISTSAIEDKEGNVYVGSVFSPFLVKLYKKDLK